MKLVQAVAVGLVLAFVGCAGSDSRDSEQIGRSHEAVISAADVLGFESTNGWSASAGALTTSSEVSEGEASLSLAFNGYSQLTSVDISSFGAVGDAVTLDVRPNQVAAWGEVRLVVKLPSLGEYWRDLGGKSLATLSAGTFHRLSFDLPSDLATKLASQYSDLSFVVTLNAPAGAYGFDRLDFGGGPQPPPLHAPAYTFALTLPSGSTPSQMVVAASEDLHVRDRTTVTVGTAPAPVWNATGPAEIGSDSVLGGVTANGDVFIGSRATITGDVRAGGTIVKQDAVVVGGLEVAEEPVSTTVFQWTERPTPSKGNVTLEPDRSTVLVPGGYGVATVKPGAKLFLRAGRYFFKSIEIHPQAEVVLEDTAGPIAIYVETGFIHRGRIRGLGARDPDLLVGFVGTGTVWIESAFPGTFVAPNGTVKVQPAPVGGHRGAFYGKSVWIEPDARVEHRAFPWSWLVPTDTSDAPVRVLTRSPVVLVSTHGYAPDVSRPGTADPPASITFEIPSSIPVTGGNAGNGTAVLSFTDPSGTPVTCVYRGGASTAHPTSTLELAKGLRYEFESCSNGLTGGDTAEGTDFQLEVNGDSEYPGGSTEVELALGKGTCSGTLEPLISPAQSLEMAQGFSWSATQALPETNPEGHPTLYYANIYVQNEEELKLLRRFLIHQQAKPLFVEELRSYKDKCGSFEHAGDGEGVFVYAVIPGKVFNRIRAATSHPDIPAAERVLFKAIILRDAPAEAIHPDGSLRYGPLQEAGFQYMNLRDVPPEEALSDELLGSSDPVAALVDSIAFVAEVAYQVGTTVVRVLGVIDRFIYGSVDVTVDFEVLNRDPAFERTQPMHYGNGPLALALDENDDPYPTSLGIPGVQVEVLQWAVRLTGIYPTNYYSYTGASGVATMAVGKSQGIVGDVAARGSSGICIEMKNYSAEFISGLLPNEVCDFRETPEFKGFDESVTVRVQTDDFDAHALAQTTEVYDYIAVGGHFPRRARVLTGHTAAVVSEVRDSGQRRLWAPCLGFPSATFSTVQLIASGLVPWKRIIIDGEIDDGLAALFGAPWYMGRLAESDIVMPRNSSASSSRAIMAHEYGHFVACSLMNEQDPDSLGILTVDVLFEGDELDPEDEARYLTEAFADFIAGQVTGGVNYFEPPTAIESGVCHFCSGAGTCLDANLNGDDTGTNQIGRVVTTYHDAFDGTERGTLPTNGDSFKLETSPSGETCDSTPASGGMCLRYATTSYGLTNDEQVALPVSAIPTWFFHWNTEANLVNALREAPMMKGLGKTVRDYGYNWCQACELFAHHGSQPRGTVQNRFLACLQEPISEYLAVDPPNSSGRIRASDCTECPPLTISAPDGTCQPCGPGEQVVGNVCSPCTAGQIVTPAGVCQDCGPQDIVVNNTCVACDSDETPDSGRTACVVCPTDLVVDWRTVPDECFEGLTVNQNDNTAPADLCPERLVVQVTELDDVFGFDPNSGGVAMGVVSDAVSAAECSSNVSSTNVGILGPGGLTPLASHQTSGSWSIVESECEHPDVVLATRAEIQAGATSRAFIASAVRGNASVPLELLLASMGQPLQCEPL